MTDAYPDFMRNVPEHIRRTVRSVYTDDQFREDMEVETETVKLFLLEGTVSTLRPWVQILLMPHRSDDGRSCRHGFFALLLDDDGRGLGPIEELGADCRRNHVNPLAAIVVSEAWATPQEHAKETLRQLRTGESVTPPKERPDRQECVIMAGATLDGRVGAIAFSLKRENPEDETSAVVSMEHLYNAFSMDKDTTFMANLATRFWKGFLSD